MTGSATPTPPDSGEGREAWEELTQLTGGHGLLGNVWAMTGNGLGDDIGSMLRSCVPSLRRAKWHAEDVFRDEPGDKRWRRLDPTWWVYEVRS